MGASSHEGCFTSSTVNPPPEKLERGLDREVLAEMGLAVGRGQAPLQKVQGDGVGAALGVV